MSEIFINYANLRCSMNLKSEKQEFATFENKNIPFYNSHPKMHKFMKWN